MYLIFSKMRFHRLLVLIALSGLILFGSKSGKDELLVLSAPAGNLYTSINKEGITVIPNGRFLTPAGKSLVVAPHPFGLALSGDGEIAVTANSGIQPLSISIIRNLTSAPEIRQVPPGFSSNSGVLESVFMGLAISPDSKKVYVAAGQENSILVFDLLTGNKIDSVDCSISADGTRFPDGYIGDIALSRDGNHIFAVDQTNFRLVIVDTRKMQVINSVPVGRYPFGVALSHDEKKVYVARHIPTGWFPSKLKVTSDGKKIIVANAKGYGSGPNGGKNFKEGGEGTYIGNLMKGTVSIIEVPSENQLKRMTSRVISNNFYKQNAGKLIKYRSANPIPLYGGQKESPIKHIVFISKENRTYDEIFGQLEKGDGDASLARYGHNVSFSNRAKTIRVEDATIMANHHKLASRFAISDNFYVDSDVSADGHRWLVNTYPNEWVETCTPASYGGNRDYKPASKAPGSLGMNGAAGAIYPEDYNESGSMWDHLERNYIDFFNFGFSVMFEPAFYDKSFKYTGIKQFANFPVPTPIFSRTSRQYPTFNTSVPDQFRISQFVKEFDDKWMGEGKILPQVLTVIIPNDHGANERPEEGYPFRESYMVDNDLAVGRIVEYLSHTPYWKNMAIFITEDDAQNGVDHIDAHRSVLMVISPFAKKNYVSKVHFSFGSIFKTFWNILGLPYLNQYDAGATDLSDMFTGVPDFTPYTALPPDVRIFDPQKALTPLDEKFDWNSLKESPVLDDPKEMVKDQKEKVEFRVEDQKKK
ncbi:MAG: bifunctional YncE family protein/alkaline phosphatase family protein [Bacteroidales bacterium]